MRHTGTTYALIALGVMLSAFGTASCNNDDTTATTPTTDTSTVTISVYSSPLSPGGSVNFLATLANDSTLQVSLVGELLDNPLRSISVPLQIDISNWDGTLCAPLDSNITAPRFTAQLQRYLTAGTYCVKLSDPGTLTQTVGAVVRVAYPAPKFFTGTASPVTFTSTLTPGGRTSKSFTLSAAGTISVSLDSLSPQSTTPVGLGLGVGGTDNADCNVSQVITVPAGPDAKITATADAGIYCGVLIDQGGLTQPNTFAMTITNP